MLTRTRTRLRERSFAAMAARLADLLAAKAPESRQLIIRDSGRTIVLPWTDIVWIEAEDYCARIHLRDRSVLVRDSLRALADALDRGSFVRVHRSAIANVACIRELVPLMSGDQRLTLDDGTVLKVSRTHRADVAKALEERRA